MLFLLLCCVSITESAFYDTFTGDPINRERFEQFRQVGLTPFCAIEVQECSKKEYRRMDASCNNMNYPSRGTMLTPFTRMLPPNYGANWTHALAKSGRPLPAVRRLRVDLIPDGRRGHEKLTQMVTNMHLFITGDVTSVHDTVNYVAVNTDCCKPGFEADRRCISIRVPDDDLHLRRSNVRCLNLTAPVTYQQLGCISDAQPPERLNTASPILDMSAVYGQDNVNSLRGREMRGGRMRTELLRGREWPPDGGIVCVNNEPPQETRCHETPTSGSNSVLGGNLLYMWFYRNHNYITRRLEKLNPCWNDDQLYYIGKEINIAYMAQIIYYELMPILVGYEYLLKRGVIHEIAGHVDDYREDLEPRISIEYVVATRWFHVLQEGRLKMYTSDGILYNEMSHVDMTLRTGGLAVNGTLEGVTQGAFRQSCSRNNYNIDPDMGERVLGRLQFASDVMSSDIMKARAAGLAPYNHYRRLCHLPLAHSFEDLLEWMPKEQVDALSRNYESMDDIELMVGILAERPLPHREIGPTLACIMAEQMLRWRTSDRFWFENSKHPGAFTEEQLYEIKKITMSRILCDNADQIHKIQPNSFLLAGPGNEMVNCKSLRSPNLEVFRDGTCTEKNDLK